MLINYNKDEKIANVEATIATEISMMKLESESKTENIYAVTSILDDIFYLSSDAGFEVDSSDLLQFAAYHLSYICMVKYDERGSRNMTFAKALRDLFIYLSDDSLDSVYKIFDLIKNNNCLFDKKKDNWNFINPKLASIIGLDLRIDDDDNIW